MRKVLCLFFLSILFLSDQGAARLKENAFVSAFVYPANGRLIPLVGFQNASAEIRIQIPSTGFDQIFRGRTDANGYANLGKFYLDPALSGTAGIYSIKASYMSPSSGLVQGIYYSADFVISRPARTTPSGEYYFMFNTPLTAQ